MSAIVELLLVRVAFAHTLTGVDPRERQVGAVEEAETYLGQIARNLRLRGFDCETVVRYGHPAESITESARTRHADLIVCRFWCNAPGRRSLASHFCMTNRS